MGQKVNPIGLRLGINRTWDSRWYADKNYADLLHEDIKVREYLFDNLQQAGITKVVIERPAKRARITIQSARPGVVIGRKGADIERLRQRLSEEIAARRRWCAALCRTTSPVEKMASLLRVVPR